MDRSVWPDNTQKDTSVKTELRLSEHSDEQVERCFRQRNANCARSPSCNVGSTRLTATSPVQFETQPGYLALNSTPESRPTGTLKMVNIRRSDSESDIQIQRQRRDIGNEESDPELDEEAAEYHSESSLLLKDGKHSIDLRIASIGIIRRAIDSDQRTAMTAMRETQCWPVRVFKDNINMGQAKEHTLNSGDQFWMLEAQRHDCLSHSSIDHFLCIFVLWVLERSCHV
ncbi:hypothetical protein C8J57DRAFT_1234272 [Mycena rebaudengoi]|nr:hypothetical protein C8J57DRAFT_1234272 [Mycena rebaudengoi]